MKPVYPDESKYSRAIFAAQLHVKSGTDLTAESAKLVCEELLRLAAKVKREIVVVTEDRVSFVDPPSDIEPGRLCEHAVPYAHACAKCDAIRRSGVPYEPGGLKR